MEEMCYVHSRSRKNIKIVVIIINIKNCQQFKE